MVVTQLRRISALLLCSLCLVACSSNSSKDVLEPADLKGFERKVNFKKSWGLWVGEGGNERYLRLRPAVDDDTVYAASADGNVIAVSADKGKRIWRTRLKEAVSGGVGLVGDTLVLGLESGEVIALSSETGEELWRAPVSSEVVAPPSGYADLVVAQTIDGKLFGLDIDTGEKRWEYDSVIPLLTLRGTSTPVVISEATFAGFANGKVVAINNETGIPLWEQRVAIPKGRSELERLVDVDGDLLLEGGVLFVTSYQSVVAALDLRSGGVVWKDEASSYQGAASGSGNIYMVTDTDSIVAIDRDKKQVTWNQSVLSGRSLTKPTRFRNLVMVADYSGYIHALAQVSGDVAGRVHMGSDLMPLKRSGSDFILNHRKAKEQNRVGVRTELITGEDHVYALSNNGYLVALTVSERQGFSELLKDVF